MQFTISRSSGQDSLVIQDGNDIHTFDLSTMNRNERNRVRELVVNKWSIDRGFAAPYQL